MGVSQNLTLTQSSQSIEGNYSRVRILWTSTQTSDSWNGYTRTAYYYVSVNGGAETTYSVNYTLPLNTKKTIVDTTITVPHNSNGSGSIKVRTWMNTEISAGVVQLNKTLTLTTIPRAAAIDNLTCSSNYLDGTFTCKYTPKTNAFYNRMRVSIPNVVAIRSVNLGQKGASQQTQGFSFTSAELQSIYERYPNTATVSIGFVIETYSDSAYSSKIGESAELKQTMSFPLSVVPTISNVSISEATEGIAAKFGAFVQNKSALAVGIAASGAYGSTIAKYETYIQAVPYRESSFTSNIITASGSIGVVTTVTDSRGRTAQISKSITVLEYSPPAINSFSAWRIKTDGVASDEGNRIAVKMNFTIASVNGKNDRTFDLKYRKSTDTEFTSFSNGSASTEYDDTRNFVTAPDISVDYAYVIRLEISDYFQTAAYEVQISTAFTIMDFRSTGKGMAIGKVSEKDALEVAMDSEFTGKLKLFAPSSDQADSGFVRMYRADGTLSAFLATSDGGDGLNLHLYSDGAWSGTVKLDKNGNVYPRGVSIVDLIYPDGAIYISANSADPSILFGGTWEQVKDRFLLAAGDVYSPGDTGGEAQHALTAAELPDHTHTFRYTGQSETIGVNAIKLHQAASNQYNAYSGGQSSNCGGQAHNNMPPYLAVYIWKRTA